MKKVLFSIVCVFVGVFVLNAQPTLLEHVTFENGIPAGWTASNTQSVVIDQDIHSTGAKSLWMKPSSAGAVTFTSPVYTITPGHNVRIEMSHLPIIKNSTVGAYIEVKTSSQSEWQILNDGGTRISPQDFDRTYGGNEASFDGLFYTYYYWNFFGNVSIPKTTMLQYLTDTSSYYYNKFTWKHAVFYLSNFLTSSDNSFQIRFVVPQTSATNNATGWFLDDIRLFESNISNEDIRVPQITNIISVPKNYNYPNCSDIEISFNLQDRNGSLSNVADSLYVEYYKESAPTELFRTPLVNVINTEYVAHIPYAGVDSVVCWRAVINDHKNNRLTYPFPYGTYFKTKCVVPFVGDTTITQTGTSEGEMIFKTGSTVSRAKYQTRYKASELLEAGFAPGVLRGLSIKITQAGAVGSLLPNFRLRVGSIAPTDTVDAQNPYSGVNEVYNNPNLALPGEGWFYFPFNPEQYITWDGVSDLIITSCFDSPNIISSSTTKIECINAPSGVATKKVELGTSGYQEACITQWPPNDSQMSKRPNFKFDFANVCFFEHDAGISRDSIISPSNAATCDSLVATTGYCIAGQNYPLTIKLRNYGTSPLDTIKVYYMLDNDYTHIQSATWTGFLDTNATTYFTITNTFSPTAGQHKLAVWTALDYNTNIVDWNLKNDTAFFNIIVSQGQMNGVYAIGGTVTGVPANRTYQSFEDAFFMMINSGVNGPVTFKVKADTVPYYNPVVFPTCVPGVSALNTVTFESADINNRVRFATIAYNNNNEPIVTDKPTFNLEGVKHFKLKNFDIRPTWASSVIKLSNLSDSIDLVGLRFIDSIPSPVPTSTDLLTASYINVGAANNIRIDSCVFNFASVASHPRAVFVKGLSPINANTGVKILNSTFNVGTRNVIYLEYNSNTTIKGNTFVNGFEDAGYAGLSESRYVVTAMNTQRLNFEANKVVLKGLSALSLSSVDNSRIVNNQISICNFSEQSVAAYLGYGVNLVSGSNDTIAFNNVYGKSLYSYDRRVVGMNLGAEGQTTANNIFKNNMMVSDGHGFAVNVKPTDPASSSASFTFSNNMYYKTTSVLGMPLLSYNGAVNTTEEDWIASTGETASSYTRDPVFVSWDNLYTTVVYPCGRGVSISNITKDFYGNNRPINSNPCIGAREYNAPKSNIHVLSTGLTSGTFDGDKTYSSCFFGNENVFVTFLNLSNDTIQAGNGKFKYKVDNNSVVSYTYPNQIIPDSIYTVIISTPFNFSTADSDVYFSLKTWSDVTADTINDNDTAWAYVNSFAQLPALAPMSVNIDYGATATLNVTSQDSIYWYYHLTDEEPFLKSHTYTTEPLLHDTAFYFSRKSEIPVLKITEIQFISATEGLTDPMPDWDLVTNNVYEISNLGTGAVDMTGYKFAYVRNVRPGTPSNVSLLSNSMTKTYTFPNNFILQPNTSVWLINKSGTSTNEVLYMGNATGVIDTNAAGFLLKDNIDSVIDAVTINYCNFNNNTHVPSTVWSGYVITPTTTQQLSGANPTTHVAGIKRINATGTNASAWTSATATNLMTIGTYDDNLTVHIANDCYGEKTTFNIIINDPPVNEIALTDIKLANGLEPGSCGLTNVSFTISMINTGAYATTTPIPLVAELYEGGTLVSTFTDNYTPSLSIDTVEYTLNGSFDVTATTQTRDFTVRIYSTLAIDTINYNDTVSMMFTSLQTPLPPITQDVNIPYASSTTLTANGGNNRLVWYADLTSDVPLATGDYTTPILYETTTYYVESLQREGLMLTVGNGTSTTGTAATATDPGPFNAKKQHVKEQYLYKAEDLINAGLEAGNINSLAFNISAVTLGSGQQSANLQNYYLRIGTTNATALSTWATGLTEVYNNPSMSLTSANVGWYTMDFDTPFVWDGTSNIVVEVCFESSVTTNTVKTYYGSKTYNCYIIYKDASNDACAWTGAITGSAQKKLPNIQFGMDVFGCNSSRSPLTVNVDDAPNCEPSLSRFVSPEGSTVESGLSTPISVVLHNNGGTNLTAATIELYIGNVATPSVSYPWTGYLASGDSVTVVIDNHTFTPGALTLTAVVVKDCDVINSNDTIRLPINICVGNSSSATTYTIAPNSSTADYSSISAAIQDLTVSGVCGPIIFNISNANYNESFTLPYIKGVSEDNTITFQAANPLAMPKINATNGILLDSTEYVIFKDIEFKTSGNITLMDINNSSNISFEGVKFTTTSATATLVNLRGANTNIEFLNDSLYGGKIQMTSELLASNTNISSGLLVSSCWFWGASSNSIALASFKNVQIVKNTIRQQASTELGKAISFRKVSGNSRIEANNIYMVNGTKVRQGIEVKASNFTSLSPLMVFNNSISIKGTSSSSINSLGIDVDTSSYVNLYFNTVNMAVSTNSASSISLKVGKGSSNVIVRNNNLDNSAKGYAYYVETATVVSLSDNNNYAINGTKFAYWAGNINDLASLRTANNMDASSFAVANPFTNDSILAILYPTDISNAGVTIEGISKDILNRNRPIAPGPTIGAYELMRNDYDAGVTQINIPLSTVDYIEEDQIPVSVKIKNFGNYSITSLDVVANLKRHQEDAIPLATLQEQYTGMLTSMDEVDFNFAGTFTAELNDPMNEPYYLEVYTIIEDDEDPLNDTSNVSVKVIPAYNLQMVKTENITERCKLFDQPITVQIKNVGIKAIHATDTVYVTYEVENRPDMSITEQLHLPYTYNGVSYDSIQHNVQIGYTFAQTADFYPLGTSDTTWKVRSYITFAKDHIQTNDTSNFITINARVSPPAPVALNDTIFYGTIGHPSATQTGHLAIKWFTDSLQAEPFYTASYSNSLGGYNPYTTANRVFADSVYYTRVNLTGTYPCESFYTEVKVVVRDRQPVDMAALRVTAPLHTISTTFNWAGGPNTGSHIDQEGNGPNASVYMEEDTVKFLIVNYGNQPATGFNVSYSIATSTTAEPTIVTETCDATILPDQQYTYSFHTLADVSDPSKTYRIRAWVDAIDDATPLNDTSDYRLVKPLNGNTQYYNPTVTEASSLDITRVQLANMDNTSIAGDDTYSDFTRTVEPAILFKGIRDTLIVQHQNASSMEAGLFHAGWMKVYVDWNRNGAFEGDDNDSNSFFTSHYPNWELVYSDTVIKTEMTNTIPITVPTNVIGGKSRMRIILSQEDSKHNFDAGETNMTIAKGEVEDYLINVLPMEDNNAQLLRFTSPSEVFQTSEQQTVKVLMKNAGHNTMTSANIHWFVNDVEQTVFNWSGNLSTSNTEEVTLGNVNVGYGSTIFRAYVELPGDTYNLDDTVAVNIFRFKTYDITYTEDFDNQLILNDDFYPYEINVTNPSNCWQLGMPNADSNTKITEAYSYPYCWKTNLNGKYPKNNVSILYTPVFNIEIIKPDTLAFMLYRAMGSATMTVEYMDYQGQWQIIGGDTLDGVPYGQRWYGGQNGFTGTSSTGWTRVAYSLDHLLTNMGVRAQFRFIFTSGSGTTSDGVAIDDFQLFKGLRDQDAGVTYVELAPSILPNYGQLFYPKVTVHNYGRENLSNYRVCYMSEDMHIPTCEDVSYGDNGIAPGGDTIYTFQTGHYLDVAMPDPFSIVAFTRLNPVDLYSENDTARANIVIGPLQKDAAVIAIEQPTEQIVSNDDVEIAIRIRNYGLEPITQLPVSYAITGSSQVDEVINFNPPLYNGDEYIYRFNQRYHASYGSVNLKVWSNLPGDYYHDNDTLYKRLQGSSYTQDIEARYITIDDRDPNTIGIQLTFLNRSSIGIGDITVGYYHDGDINNKVEESYRLGNVLPAGSYGYHYFTQKLPRNVYQSICAYVVVPNEVNLSNDTTCTLMIGYTDGFADTIFIEETVAEDCLVQLVGHNNGTLGGNTTVTAHYVINGDWANIVSQTFNWEFDEPNPNIRQYMTFSNRIPKSANGQYDIIAWLDYPNDWHHWNDTTRIYQVKTFVGLEEVVANESGFVLEQNVPNPYDKQTDITFTIPQSDNVKFYITNTIGQVVYSQADYYQSGKHTINFDSKDLPEGIYYYTMEYRREKQVRKMIIVR